MSYKIYEDEMSIKSQESLNFDLDIWPEINNLKKNIQNEIKYNAEDFFEFELEKMKKFLAYKLTKEDKLYILEKIMNDYEYEKYYHGNYNVSIFDKEFIMKAINDWTQEKFNFIY